MALSVGPNAGGERLPDLHISRKIMALNEATRTRLMGSLEANRLVLPCGAGLSIPAPSGLMSAVQVSRRCYDKYESITALPATYDGTYTYTYDAEGNITQVNSGSTVVAVYSYNSLNQRVR